MAKQEFVTSNKVGKFEFGNIVFNMVHSHDLGILHSEKPLSKYDFGKGEDGKKKKKQFLDFIAKNSRLTIKSIDVEAPKVEA